MIDSRLVRDLLVQKIMDKPYERRETFINSLYDSDDYRTSKYIIIGENSAYFPHDLKLIDASVFPFTASELSRSYLSEIWDRQTGKKRISWTKKTHGLLAVPVPHYFSGYQEGRFCYVDIRRAWMQIYMPFGVDLRFNPDDGALCRGEVEFLWPDLLQSEKKLWLPMGGMFTHKANLVSRYGRLDYEKSYNKWLAPELWGLITYTLHSIFHEVVRDFGAYYVNNDGCIVDESVAEDLISYLFTEWSMSSSVKFRGKGFIKAHNCYSITGHTPTHADARPVSLPTNNLLPYRPFLARKLKMLRYGRVSEDPNTAII